MNRLNRNARFPLALMAMASACLVSAAGTSTADNPEGVGAPRQPVEYLVKEKSLIGNEMFEAGQTCKYAGLPSENLEPTCDIGRARAKEYKESNKARVSAMIDQNKDVAGGLDPQAFMANMMKVQAEMAAEQAQAQTLAIASAVSRAVAETIAAMFPNGVPGAVPAEPAETLAIASDPAPASTEGVADDGANTSTTDQAKADASAPVKRTKG